MANIRLVAACGRRYYIHWALCEVDGCRFDFLIRGTIFADTLVRMVGDDIISSGLRAFYYKWHADVSNTGELLNWQISGPCADFCVAPH
jgi:hypothetical protein